MPLLWHHGLETGDDLGGSLFPQVLPEPIPAEGAVRALGPEPPDLSILQEIAALHPRRDLPPVGAPE